MPNWQRACVLSTFLPLSGCVTVPDLPPDAALPIREILLHSACELRDAFRSLYAPEYARLKSFKPDRWLISITLQPRVDANLVAGGGLTRKSTTQPLSVKSLITWAVGPPGVQLDAKSWRSGNITYTIKSPDLIRDTELPCYKDTLHYHALTRNLGVGEWLRRTIAATDSTTVAQVDKPTYTSNITIKFSANGSYSYAFSLGSDQAALSGFYQMDEQLSILMTQLPAEKKFTVVTLPTGEKFWSRKEALVGARAEAVVVEEAKSRLDTIQLEQAIRGLQLPVQ